MEQDFCIQCGECCRKIAVDFEQKLLYRNGIEILTDEFASYLIPIEKRENITFCTCKFLKNNMCSHMHKPNICTLYPSSPFSFLPENCGYEGYIFIKQEKIKQQIRKLKEEILSYEAQILINKSEEKQLRRIIERHYNYINKYKIYGANDW